MSGPEREIPSAFLEWVEPRSGDALVMVYTDIPYSFLPLQLGTHKSPQFHRASDMIYLPRGGTGAIILGEDFEPILLKHFKRNEDHSDDRLIIFFDGTFTVTDRDDFRMREGKDLFFRSGEIIRLKEIDEDIGFRVRFQE